MNLAQEAYSEIYPEHEENRTIKIAYSAKFKSFNANVKYTNSYILFNLSKDWLDFSEDLRKGLIHHLLIKMFPKRKHIRTFELDLYEKFIDNVGKYARVEHHDDELGESFDRINDKYFDGLMEKPNLKWGQKAFRKLGHYEYASNTVVISDIFRAEEEFLDYVMHHELLHKKHGSKTSLSGRVQHHTKEFRADEAKYEDKDAERKLTKFLRRKRARNIFGF